MSWIGSGILFYLVTVLMFHFDCSMILLFNVLEAINLPWIHLVFCTVSGNKSPPGHLHFNSCSFRLENWENWKNSFLVINLGLAHPNRVCLRVPMLTRLAFAIIISESASYFLLTIQFPRIRFKAVPIFNVQYSILVQNSGIKRNTLISTWAPGQVTKYCTVQYYSIPSQQHRNHMHQFTT